MTNEHCISSQAELNQTDFEFGAEGASCAQNCAFPFACPGTVEASGGSLIKADQNLDYALVLPAANSSVPLSSTYGYLQMKATGATFGEEIYIPGHPMAWGRRIASEVSDSGALQPATIRSLSQKTCAGHSPYNELGYTADTQHGSSGSPVINRGENLVVGLHHCGGCEPAQPYNLAIPIQVILEDLNYDIPLCGASGTVNFGKCNMANCLDWDQIRTSSYSSQDFSENVQSMDGGDTIYLEDNTWRRSEGNLYVRVFPNTILEFDFSSTSEGEIHGIGFDENNNYNDAKRLFQIHGTQPWNMAFGNYDNLYHYNGNSSSPPKVRYSIPVGEFYTGTNMKFVFVNDHDHGANSNSSYSNVIVYENEPGTCDNELCLDWNYPPNTTSSYSNQDFSHNVQTMEGGDTIYLEDNTWRRTNGATFTITANTVLVFEFSSSSEGEIHGIGFDENNNHDDAKRIFQLFGTQPWDMTFKDFDNYPGGTGGPGVIYRIPVGQYYTGANMRLVIVNDQDSGTNSNSYFTNVRIFEDP